MTKTSFIKHKKAFVFVLLLFLCTMLFAEGYTISGYKFEIKGSTQESTIRRLIVPGKVEKFDSEEALKAALEDKKHILVNTRIFYENEIFYHYDIDPSGGGNHNVFVTFATTDAKNKLILPYPKYDSNTGLVLGLRYKDKNFMGLYKDLSVIFDAKQHNSSFKEGDFYLEIPFEEIKFKNISFSGTFESELDLHEKQNDYVLLDIRERGLKIAKANLNLDGLVDFNYYNGSFRRLKYGFNYGNLPLGNKGMYLNLSSNLLFDWRLDHLDDTNLNEAVAIGGIPVKNMRIYNRSYIKFIPKNKKDYDEGIRRHILQDTIRFSFVGPYAPYSVGSTITHYKEKDYNSYDYLEISSNLSYKINSKYTAALLFITKWRTDRNFTNFIIGRRLTVNSSLFKIPYTFTLAEYDDFDTYKGKVSPYFGTTLKFSYDKINYRGNFRIGHEFSVNTSFEWHPWEDNNADKTKYFFNVEALTFPFILKFPFGINWFNPFFKFRLLASSESYYWKDNSSVRLKKDDIQKLFRGIRSDNKYVEKAYDSSMLVGAFNINLMTNLFEFEDFGWTYLNLFWDAGLIRSKHFLTIDDRKKDFKFLSGAGFEIICIMNSHPGYPIRASVGFNTEKLYEKFIEKKDDTEVEYEVYIGIGFAY